MNLLELLTQQTCGTGAMMRYLIPELQQVGVLNLNSIADAIDAKDFALKLWMYNYETG